MLRGSGIALQLTGPLQGGSTLFASSQGGRPLLAVILKTAYTLGAGQLTPAPPEPIVTSPRHYGDDAARSIRVPADLVARLPRAEILHAGAVFAPAGVTMTRIALVRSGQVVFEKRKLAKKAEDSPGLGPIPLEGLPAIDANGIAVIPPNFDFAVFQAAPADQRCDRLLAGDQIVLANLHPEAAELIITLPSRAPAARALLGGREAPIALECKRVLLDTDTRRVTLTWLGELALPDLETVKLVKIEARAPDAPVATPADPRQLLRNVAAAAAAAAPAAARPQAPSQPGTGTMLILDDAPMPAAPAATPFAPRAVIPAGPPPPQAPALPPPPPPPPPKPPAPPPRPPGPPVRGTMLIEAVKQPAAAPLPFANSGSSKPNPPRPADSSATPWGGPIKPAPQTLEDGETIALRRAGLAPAIETIPAPPPEPGDGAELEAPAPKATVPEPQAAIPEPKVAVPEPPPPPPPPPKESEPKREFDADPWAKNLPRADTAKAAPPPPKPEASKPEPRASALKMLYKKLK